MKKKFLFLAIAIACIAVSTSSFKKATPQKKAFVNFWWDYNGFDAGGELDPSNYTKDGNNFPDCPLTSGSIYCEIYAPPSYSNPNEPDLANITGYRMRQN
jgi:hypothetical protein